MVLEEKYLNTLEFLLIFKLYIKSCICIFQELSEYDLNIIYVLYINAYTHGININISEYVENYIQKQISH